MPVLQPQRPIVYENFILIPQAPLQPLFRPMERPADGAFVYASGFGNLANIQALKVVGQHRFPLQRCQLLRNDIFNPFELGFPWQTGPLVVVKECISHCGSTPFRNSVR